MGIIIIVFVHFRIAPSSPQSRFDLSAIGIRELIIGRRPHSIKLFGPHKHVGGMGLLVEQFERLPWMGCYDVS